LAANPAMTRIRALAGAKAYPRGSFLKIHLQPL